MEKRPCPTRLKPIGYKLSREKTQIVGTTEVGIIHDILGLRTETLRRDLKISENLLPVFDKYLKIRTLYWRKIYNFMKENLSLT